jgi:hypothetical protein
MAVSRYRVIAKVQLTGGDWIFRKFYTNDLINFRSWVVKRYNDYAFINVFSNVGINKGKQVGSITKLTKIWGARPW